MAMYTTLLTYVHHSFIYICTLLITEWNINWNVEWNNGIKLMKSVKTIFTIVIYKGWGYGLQSVEIYVDWYVTIPHSIPLNGDNHQYGTCITLIN